MSRYYNDVRNPAIWTAAKKYSFPGQFVVLFLESCVNKMPASLKESSSKKLRRVWV
jgi:hypothetical protein